MQGALGRTSSSAVAWPGRSPNFVAAVAAVVLTGSLLLPFLGRPDAYETRRESELTWLRLLPDAAERAAPLQGTRHQPGRTKAPTRAHSVDLGARPGVGSITEPASSIAPAAHESHAAESALESTAGSQDPTPRPLRLDPSVLRQASQAGKSSARQMAERSGAYFGDSPPSAQDSLAKATAASGKPACLGEGDHLLSSIYAVYLALRDKCSAR